MTSDRLLDRARVFANACAEIGDMDELKTQLGSLLAPFGFPYFASGKIGHIGLLDTLHFANWDPVWFDLYAREGFLHIDPVPLWAAVSGVPTGMRELRASLPPGHPALRVLEAGEPFGYGGGYIVPQRSMNNQFGAVAFVGARDPESLEDRFALRALAGVAFERAEIIAGRSQWPILPAPRTTVTIREREVLSHLMQGRSATAIAAALDVSPATVRFHVTNLKAKTGASNTAQLTAFGVSLGLSPRRA